MADFNPTDHITDQLFIDADAREEYNDWVNKLDTVDEDDCDEPSDIDLGNFVPEDDGETMDDIDYDDDGYDYDEDEPWDGFRDDVEADADALRSAGWGTDEDYGGYDGMDYDFDCYGEY